MEVATKPPALKSHVDRRFAIACINATMRLAERAGWYRGEIQPRRIMDKLRAQTGLDWRDRSFEEPLNVLADSWNNEADLHPVGRMLMAMSTKVFLRNRLLLEAAWEANPAALDVPVRRPLFVIGLPRTGTTLLYNLLCQDPQGRPLQGWESFFPVADRGRDGRPVADGRRKRCRSFVWHINRMAPRLKSVHELVADGPEECTWLLHNSFLSTSQFLQARVPTYARYVKSRPRDDWRRVYVDYANALRHLQHDSAASHWVLKSPAHQHGLAGLLDVIPNACVVQTHRDPQQVIGSCCSLFSVVRGVYSDQVYDEILGPEVLDHLQLAVRRAMEARDERPERFFDVGFKQLVEDPIGSVRRIYDHFGYAFDPQMEVGMRRWLKENPQGKHGKHHYDLAQFGLTAEQVQQSMGDDWDRAQAALR